MEYSLQFEQEVDGRWLAEVPELPGVLAYGSTSDEAIIKAETLALRVIADQLEHGETTAPSVFRRPNGGATNLGVCSEMGVYC